MRRRRITHLCWWVGVCLVQGAGIADSLGQLASPDEEEAADVDKSGFTLWNPTPRSLMRPLTTDRRDRTESPYTVDAGHFQMELDLVVYAHDHDRSDDWDIVTEAWSVASMNLRLGLLNNVDAQMLLDPYSWVRTEDRVEETTERQSGFGDMALRVKVNLWGNDSGATALAAMPFVKLPTNQDHLGNNAVEGGIILPFALDLPGGWSVWATTAFDFFQDEAASGYSPAFINTVSLGHDITKRLSGYAEFFSEVSTEDDMPWIGSVGAGVTYLLATDLHLDVGANIGATEAAEDVTSFLTLAFRF